MSQDTEFLRAHFTTPDGEVNVHFNPATLQYTVTNTMQQRGGGNRQFVSASTGKLAMELVFDTTHDGTDVRVETQKLSKLMQPGPDKLVPTITFEWGLYKFEGTMETYKETLDFFSPNGVPLRAALSLGLAATKEQVFARGTAQGAAASFGTGGDLALDTVVLPPSDAAREGGGTGQGSAGSPQDAATRGGNPGGARALAAANGAESLRFSGGGGLAVAASISLGAPVAFASGGAGGGLGLSAGAGAGFGVSGGAGLGVSGGASAGIGLSGGGGASAGAGAGIGLSGGASAGIGLSGGGGASAGAGVGIGLSAGAAAGIGLAGGASAGASLSAGAGARVGSASAGLTAGAGAFAGLGVKARVAKSAAFRVERLVPGPGAAHLATGGGARFAVGGRALAQGGGSLRADVGATASLRGRVSFDGEG